MTSEKENEIRRLARIFGEKKMRFEQLSYVNVYGKTWEEMLKCYEDGAVAEREMFEARLLLRAAIEGHDKSDAAKEGK